ncbi:uroporphyrin-III C-methyltransferase [Galdieria sulphuraria]|uniref:Uroporphyrin-III C-methyltransferase n=1 Tax=Galdieria sulphuraria TaxID=130081 RepID=M2W0Q1_GALSU|nr:uroporphyrin-III C-methyltransferase [Galdieria sulphuraria]EME29191.1 uroporphyrin-III C-methyltransferase [Galdieria sulphuraria]|eukprot:XP_005705711.1 uroporphyrin-III C-methyltransferase [Galdieria sulphuraria]
MATRNLSEIAQRQVQRLIENGKSSDTPAAVIYNAGMFNQQEVFGTLKEWASRELKVQFQPGTVVVGKIVEYAFAVPMDVFP